MKELVDIAKNGYPFSPKQRPIIELTSFTAD
jgi:hypothetical protein